MQEEELKKSVLKVLRDVIEGYNTFNSKGLELLKEGRSYSWTEQQPLKNPDDSYFSSGGESITHQSITHTENYTPSASDIVDLMKFADEKDKPEIVRQLLTIFQAKIKTLSAAEISSFKDPEKLTKCDEKLQMKISMAVNAVLPIVAKKEETSKLNAQIAEKAKKTDSFMQQLGAIETNLKKLHKEYSGQEKGRFSWFGNERKDKATEAKSMLDEISRLKNGLTSGSLSANNGWSIDKTKTALKDKKALHGHAISLQKLKKEIASYFPAEASTSSPTPKK